MKVLMFGWESPPKYMVVLLQFLHGITKELSLQGVIWRRFSALLNRAGEEEKFLKIIGMNQVPSVWRDVNYDCLKLFVEMTPGRTCYSFPRSYLCRFSYMREWIWGVCELAGGLS